jgi:hypothetical protein
MFQFAVRLKDNLLRDINWWPLLIPKEEGDRIVPWTVMPFSYHVKNILKAAGIIPEKNWKAKAMVLLQEYCYDYKNRGKYIQAMALLIASDNDTLTEIEEYLKDIHDYDFGEYDHE